MRKKEDEMPLSIPYLPSPNRRPRPKGAAPDIIVLHSTGGAYAGALSTLRYRNPVPWRRVSAHYLIARSGAIVKLVPVAEMAYHAGKSAWKGTTDINRYSVGIEMEHYDGRQDWPAAQVTAAAALCKELCKSESISVLNIVGHNEIAVPKGRKVDPMAFPWESFRRKMAGG